MKKLFLLALFVIIGYTYSTAQYNVNVLPQNYDWSESTLLQNETTLLKNPNKAMWISVGSTIGTYLALVGLSATENPNPILFTILSFSQLASPALGYLYTDNWNDFWNSVTRRFVGRLVIGTGALIVIVSSLDSIFESGNQNTGAMIAGFGLMLGGAVYNISITFNDFKQVRTRVDEYNEGLVQSLQLMPAIDPVNKTLGVGFRINF